MIKPLYFQHHVRFKSNCGAKIQRNKISPNKNTFHQKINLKEELHTEKFSNSKMNSGTFSPGFQHMHMY